MGAEYHIISRIYQEKLGKHWEENSDFEENVKVQILYIFLMMCTLVSNILKDARKLRGDYKMFQ